MSVVVQGGKGKRHLANWTLSLGVPKLITVCGKEVKEGTLIIESDMRVNLCNQCWIWVGKQAVGDWLGLDFFTELKTSIYKHKRRSE